MYNVEIRKLKVKGNSENKRTVIGVLCLTN